MNEDIKKEKTGNDLSTWLSTYGLITTERILERYKIRLPQEELAKALKNPRSFYHRLIRVPLKNVLNGIILQQAYDYQVYAQKMFIDYLMSGETTKPEEAPGGITREDLEKERQILVEMGETFHQQELAHNKLIGESQASLIKNNNEWQKYLSNAAKTIKKTAAAKTLDEELIKQALHTLLSQQNFSEGAVGKEIDWSPIKEVLAQQRSTELREAFAAEIPQLGEFITSTETLLQEFMEQISQTTQNLRKYRADFYALILRTDDLIKKLPDHRYNPAQVEENRESLYFDPHIGEEGQ